MKTLYKSTGILRYSGNWRLAVEVDQQLANYYRALIPVWKNAKRGRWPAHITVVREEKEKPTKEEAWGKYEGEQLEFLYDPSIKQGKIYFWLDVWSNRLEDIRAELGLPIVSRYTLPPEGFTKCFHMTIANTKD